VPWQYAPEDPNRIRWLPEADQVWKAIINDKPLPKKLLDDAINAEQLPGSPPPSGSAGPSGSPSSSPSGTPSSPSTSPTGQTTQEAAEEAAANGLCA
jgi:hypothetical protein